MLSWIRPKDTLESSDIDKGLRMLLYDGICSQVMGVFTGGAFLVAFAMLLGASNTMIGLIAAAGPLTQILQIPAILLVDRIRLRKALVVANSLLGRLFWLVLAALPWLVPPEQRLSVLLVCLFAYFGLGTISGCAWTSWVRDLIPEKTMGTYFSRRMAIATAVGAALTLAAGIGVDLGKRAMSDPLSVYSILFFLGALAGLVGVCFLGLTPEPRMTSPRTENLLALLAEPFRERNFRQLLKFLGIWNFAINLAAPFFVVYMLRRLGMSMGWVLGLSVLSQIVNVLFYPIWGRLADRRSNKAVLTLSGPLFIVSIALWPFTTMPEQYFLTLPLLIVIHLLAGVSTAGVNLCASNIALKISPRGRATAFLASSSMVNGIAATLAPILAGLAADWFSRQEMSIAARWLTLAPQASQVELPVFNLRGLDFVFAFAVLLGIYAMHRLLAVREEGEIEEKIGFSFLLQQARKSVRHISNVAGLRTLTYFPYARLTGSSPKNENGQQRPDSTADPE